jgi:flotillin
LDATVRKPAEAEQYRVRTLAEARQFQLQTEATGEAEAIRRKGEAEADAAKAKGLAEAEILRQKGLAEAEVIRQQGLSEAEATLKKADAWKEYTQAAVLQQLLDKLPEIASAISAPLAKTDRIVVVSTGGENGSGAGASKITQDVTNIIAQVPATVEALTGMDLLGAIGNLPGLRRADNGKDEEEEETDE